MADPCDPLVIRIEQSVSSMEELESAAMQLNPILRKLIEEATSRERLSTGHTKITMGFIKAIAG